MAENVGKVESAVTVLAEEFRANQVGGATARWVGPQLGGWSHS